MHCVALDRHNNKIFVVFNIAVIITVGPYCLVVLAFAMFLASLSKI